jgi:hypothetical protein
LIPGGVLIIFGALVVTPGQESNLPLLRWWPMLLILLGVIVAWRSRRARPVERLELHAAPNAANPRKRTSPPADAATGAAAPSGRTRLGDYSQPAPGATVEVLPDLDD